MNKVAAAEFGLLAFGLSAVAVFLLFIASVC